MMIRPRTLAAAALLLLASSAWCRAQYYSSASAGFSLERWDENYSYLKDPANRTDYLDPIKYIPIDDLPDWYLSLGAQIRDRYEYFNHVAFGSGRQDRDGYNLFRFLPYVDLHMGPNFRVF